MSKKPVDADLLSVYTYWDSPESYTCPLCDEKIDYAYNDGGRELVTLKGKLWIITNYYRCTNSGCPLHKAFPILHENVIKNKKFGKDIWERIIRYHFKTHLDYGQIKEILWDDSEVSIAKSTIASICDYFKTAGITYLDQKIKEEIKDQGYIILTLDGAQPKKGTPALWIFTDRGTRHTIYSTLLDSAIAPVLTEIMRTLEKEFQVPIKVVISDKQKNIVNAVKEFNPELPHIYCQYHFLNHIMEPIISKDSHIATQLKKTIRNLSLVVNLPKAYLSPRNKEYNSHYATFAPLAEELLNAIAVRGRKWEVLPGKEIYENIQFIYNELSSINLVGLTQKVKYSIKSVMGQLKKQLNRFKLLYDEILHLIDDSNDLRNVLSQNRRKSKTIKKAVKTWVYRLQSRLKRRDLENNPSKLKYIQFRHDTILEEIWQQWIRLEWSYHEGLYHSYDDPEYEKTNNPTEQLINQIKRHFKKWLGQQDIQQIFERHSEDYSQLIELDYSPEQLNEILWKQTVAFVPGKISPLESFQATIKRNWRISEISSGNFELFLQKIKS